MKTGATLLYDNWSMLIANLPDEQAGQLIKAICNRRIGQEYHITDPVVSAIYSSWEPKLVEDEQKYRDKCEKARQSVMTRYKHEEPKQEIVRPKRNVFQKPTVDEVREYCKERKNTVDAEQFVNWYDANGWKVGSNPMKDWKAAVRTWEKRSGAPKVAKKSKWGANEEHNYDFDDLEKKLGAV